MLEQTYFRPSYLYQYLLVQPKDVKDDMFLLVNVSKLLDRVLRAFTTIHKIIMPTLFFIILMVKMHQILSDDVQRNEKFFRKTLPKEFRENQTRSTKTVPHQNEKICDYCRLSPHNTYCLHR